MAPSPASPDSRSERSFGEPPAKKRRSDDAEANNGPARRQEACGACRLRKVKCDKKRPSCDMCRAKDLDCEYLGDATKVTRLDQATSTILERLDLLRDDVQSVKQVLSQGSGLGSGLGSGSGSGPGLGHRALPARLSYSDTRSAETSPAMLETSAVPIATTTTAAPDSDAIERSRDFLRIPPQRTSADSVLAWDVFEHKYPANALVGVLFGAEAAAPPSIGLPDGSSAGGPPPDQERIPLLIDRFLQNVHTKNAILDVEALLKHGRQCAEHGVGWDGWSCLVLLACALGSVAQPYGKPAPGWHAHHAQHVHHAHHAHASSARLHAAALQQGQAWFALACRRLGALQYSMLGAQCYFFAGVYLMYTLRPIPSWHYFHHASIFCHFHLRMAHGLADRLAEVFDGTPSHRLTAAERKARRLEQSLYWSCFKSECEFRVELPLPQSDISLDGYPNLFPSPPSPITPKNERSGGGGGSSSDDNNSSSQHHRSSVFDGLADEDLSLRRHAVRLCNEEESWYYYLTEIALRRIGNRIINTFFHQARSTWLHIKPLLRMAQEFEAQISSWSANLPPAMQHYKTAATIRAPYGGGGADDSYGSDGGHVSRELSWAIDNRLLEMQTWLYQPFLYYLVHVGLPPAPTPTTTTHSAVLSNLLNPFPTPDATDYSPGGLSPSDVAVLRSLVHAGITCCLKTIEVRAQTHRHHGLWFDLRSTMCASLVLLAVVKSGHAAWIPGGADSLWGAPLPVASPYDAARPIGGKLAKVLAQFAFWGAEAPDMLWHKSVLEAVVRDVRGS